MTAIWVLADKVAVSQAGIGGLRRTPIILVAAASGQQ
jgi:hypothetical protein